MSVEQYVGGELALFADAHRWKSYFSDRIKNHLGHNVLEVGAGLGGTTAILTKGFQGSWCCLEPDPELARKIDEAVTVGELPATCSVSTGTLATLPESAHFDSILYIDVLEHIEHDAAEAALAASRLSSGGKLIILSPAYQWLYSPFDQAIGHFRRYSKRTLLKAIPEALELVEFSYLDSVGLLASAGNRFVTKASLPTPAQIRLWDRLMVPLSRLLDPLVAHSFGKSVFGVWQKR
jgi:protein-L-isoaspartate O-methyltransferase